MLAVLLWQLRLVSPSPSPSPHTPKHRGELCRSPAQESGFLGWWDQSTPMNWGWRHCFWHSPPERGGFGCRNKRIVSQPTCPLFLKQTTQSGICKGLGPLASLLHAGQMSERLLGPAAAAILHRCSADMGCWWPFTWPFA